MSIESIFCKIGTVDEKFKGVTFDEIIHMNEFAGVYTKK